MDYITNSSECFFFPTYILLLCFVTVKLKITSFKLVFHQSETTARGWLSFKSGYKLAREIKKRFLEDRRCPSKIKISDELATKIKLVLVSQRFLTKFPECYYIFVLHRNGIIASVFAENQTLTIVLRYY